MRGLLGLAALLAIAWALSEDRRRIPWRTVIAGVALQWALAVLLLGFPAGERGDLPAQRRRDCVADGNPGWHQFRVRLSGWAASAVRETHPGASFILAFQALPLVLTISALASLLFYWGVLQRITATFAWLLRRAMGIGGALALGAAVHVFVGMIEAPLLVRPYLARMQRGELFALMTCGMAGVAGTVMVIYASFLSPLIPNALGNILIASVISTPAALAIAALMVPFGTGGSGGRERLIVAGSAAQHARRAGEGHVRRRSGAGRHCRHIGGGSGICSADQHGTWRAAAHGAMPRSRCSGSLRGRSVR